MKNNDKYTLLYNDLWLADPDKLRKLNPDLVVKSVGTTHPIASTVKLSEEMPVSDSNKHSAVPDTSVIHESQEEEPKCLVADKSFVQQNVVGESDSKLINSWDLLVDAVNNCKECKLCYGRKHVVIERGSRTSPWMFVGEGPGEQEDLQGKPFVGSAGLLLNKMIAAMQLNVEHDVYICNVVKCRPPANRNPEPEEITACKNYLLSQIALVKPRIIITLGRFAAQTLLDSELSVGKLRQTVHRFGDTPLIVTYHPAYLLRNPSAKKDAWSDLQLALQTFA